jgi:hypothetical protein
VITPFSVPDDYWKFHALALAMAQSNGYTSAGKAPDQIISEMKERLNLTEERAEQFHPIMEESIEIEENRR